MTWQEGEQEGGGRNWREKRAVNWRWEKRIYADKFGHVNAS